MGKSELGFKFEAAMKLLGVNLDVNSYSSLLACCSAQRDADRATLIWQEMLKSGVQPDQVACSSYMWACLEGARPDLTLKIFYYWKKDGTPPGWRAGRKSNIIFFSQVSEIFASQGKWTQYRRSLRLQRWLRNQGEEPSTLQIKTLKAKSETMGGLWQQVARLAEPFLPMSEESVAPSPVSYSYAIMANERLGRMQAAHTLANELIEVNFGKNPVEYAACLSACSAVSALEPALKIVEKARNDKVILSLQGYTSAISICAEHCKVDSALWILREMTSSGLRPNQHTINSILSVCASCGRLAGALKLFHGMRSSFGVEPDIICFATMWGMLGKANRWNDALRFFIVAEKRSFKNGQWPYPQLSRMFQNIGHRQLPSPSSFQTIDLHNLSTIGASVVFRGWIMILREAYRQRDLPSGMILSIIPGQGRNSPSGHAKLKPFVINLLTEHLGQNLPFHINSSNSGQIFIHASDFKEWIKSGNVDLGLGGRKGEEKLMRLLANNNANLDTLEDIQS